MDNLHRDTPDHCNDISHYHQSFSNKVMIPYFGNISVRKIWKPKLFLRKCAKSCWRNFLSLIRFSYIKLEYLRYFARSTDIVSLGVINTKFSQHLHRIPTVYTLGYSLYSQPARYLNHCFNQVLAR